MKSNSAIVCVLLVLLSTSLVIGGCASQSGPVKSAAGEYEKGKYTNKTPAFSVQFPDSWRPITPKNKEVFRVANMNEWQIPVAGVDVGDKAKDAPPIESETAAQNYLKGLKESNPQTSRHRIESWEAVKLSDGTPAMTLIIKWQWDAATVLTTAGLVAYKDDKVVSLSNTTVVGGDTPPQKLLEMLKTLKFM